jgi:tannase/feruloyl esterase
VAVLINVFGVVHAAEPSAAQCEQISKLSLRNTTVTLAQEIAAGQLKDVNAVPAQLAAQLPTFCRVAATLKPSNDSDIKIEVWLPNNWNGRLESVGNGGLAGSISYSAMALALKGGFATASTDTGHTGTASSGDWALGHPEKLIDFAHRSEHEMTIAAKALIKNFYGHAQHHAYWNGCSEGGNQALREAQQYPRDYDGILAGAPANYMTHLQVGGLWISHAIHKDPASFISAKKLPAINQAVLEACDEIDGLKDNLVGDPRACAFDVAKLRCRGDETDECLTAPQLNGLAKVYAGARNPHTSEQIFPGYMPGSELEWNGWILGSDAPPKTLQHAIAENLSKYAIFGKTDWDWKTFDFDKDLQTADRVAGVTNTTNPDLNAFKQHGGKLLQYHGWYDPAISPLNSVNYFESVQKKMGDTKSFYRLFMIPGMAHCGGGPGASEFDRMNVIVNWVEDGKAPDTIVVSRNTNGAIRTRPLCPYPLAARYKGSGSADDAQNFACVNSAR